MGLYEDVNRDLSDAFNTDLLDAVRIIQFIVVTDSYDDETMINTTTETPTDVRAVVSSDFEGERIDEAPLTNSIKILVIDSDRNSVEFKVDMIIKDNTATYKLRAFNPDPAKASWTIYARRLG